MTGAMLASLRREVVSTAQGFLLDRSLRVARE